MRQEGRQSEGLTGCGGHPGKGREVFFNRDVMRRFLSGRYLLVPRAAALFLFRDRSREFGDASEIG